MPLILGSYVVTMTFGILFLFLFMYLVLNEVVYVSRAYITNDGLYFID